MEVAALGEAFIHAGDGLISNDRRLGNILAALGARPCVCARELQGHLDVRSGEPHRLFRKVLRSGT